MELTSETEKNINDPFAADIFASPADREKRQSETAENGQIAVAVKSENLWSRHLPQVSATEILWDARQINLLQFLSAGIFNQMTKALARLLNLPAGKNIEFSFAGKREVNDAENFSPENVWWLTVKSGSAEIFFSVGEAFAVWLADTALDARNDSEPVVLRPLTMTETAVLEYFALNLAHEANRSLQSAQIRYRTLSREIPDALQKIVASENFSLLVYKLQAAKDLPPAVFEIYLTPEALKSFSPNESLRANLRERLIENLPEQVKNIRARFVCGNAELTFGELAALENGDVILFDKQGFLPAAANFSGQTEILFGDGERQKIIGELKIFDRPPNIYFADNNTKTDDKVSVRRINFDHSLLITTGSFAQFEISPRDKFMTETNDNLTNENPADESVAVDEQESGLAVENLVVALRVELEARRLPLSEIAGLRENQTLELGVRPTDEVNILVDDRAIGRGELVLVEGTRLGVKITKLLR